MLWWPRRGRWARTAVLGGLVVLVLLVAAKLHACACTGGRPHWQSVAPMSEP